MVKAVLSLVLILSGVVTCVASQPATREFKLVFDSGKEYTMTADGIGKWHDTNLKQLSLPRLLVWSTNEDDSDTLKIVFDGKKSISTRLFTQNHEAGEILTEESPNGPRVLIVSINWDNSKGGYPMSYTCFDDFAQPAVMSTTRSHIFKLWVGYAVEITRK